MKDKANFDKRIELRDKAEALSTARVIGFPSQAERDLRRWLNRTRREVARAEEELEKLEKEI